MKLVQTDYLLLVEENKNAEHWNQLFLLNAVAMIYKGILDVYISTLIVVRVKKLLNNKKCMCGRAKNGLFNKWYHV